MARVMTTTANWTLPANESQPQARGLGEATLDRLIFLGVKAALAGLTDGEEIEYRETARALAGSPLFASHRSRPSQQEEFDIVKRIMREGGMPVPDGKLWSLILSTANLDHQP